MAKLDLRIRDLQSGDTANIMFESENDAAEWIRNRPRFKTVLGVATHGLDEGIYKLLREESRKRPLDEDENVLNRAIEDALDAAWRAQQEEARRQDEEEIAAHREAMKSADPHRPMNIRWDHEHGFSLDDPTDSREITEAAREAVLAWVAERTAWVADRGQYIAEAVVTVWPGVIPAGQGSERVHSGGQFVPLTRDDGSR